MLSTMRRIATELTDSRSLVLRYRPRDGATDGVSGGEGSFLLCTYWLAECLARAGEIEEAREVFERATAYANAAWAIAEQEADAGQGATAQSE